MQIPLHLLTVTMAVSLVACSPALDWREVALEDSTLMAMLPCKPDRAERQVQMGDQTLPMLMQGCQTAGATFAVTRVTLSDIARSDDVLQQWRMVSTAHLKPTSVTSSKFELKGATPWPGSQKVIISGRRPDGGAVQGQVAYFASGPQLFQALVYADRLQPDQVEPFFSGLRFR